LSTIAPEVGVQDHHKDDPAKQVDAPRQQRIHRTQEHSEAEAGYDIPQQALQDELRRPEGDDHKAGEDQQVVLGGRTGRDGVRHRLADLLLQKEVDQHRGHARRDAVGELEVVVPAPRHDSVEPQYGAQKHRNRDEQQGSKQERTDHGFFPSREFPCDLPYITVPMMRATTMAYNAGGATRHCSSS
jgi:hypothetical protein